MLDLNVEEKIRKSIKFIAKKFAEAVIEVKIVGLANLYIKIMGKDYEVLEEYSGKCSGILIIQNGENNFYKFKEILKNVPEYFDGNGTVFLRYEISECDNAEYVSNQFSNFFKLNKYTDVEEYSILSETNDIKSLFISAKYHIELLDKNTEYEDYTSNFYINRTKCQGGGCSSGNCGKCTKQCCKK